MSHDSDPGHAGEAKFDTSTENSGGGYPFFVHRKAEDYGGPGQNAPWFWPHRPVIATPFDDVDDYAVTISGAEEDSFWEYFNVFGTVNRLVELGQSLLRCFASDLTACAQATCELAGAVADIGELVAEGVNDALGTAMVGIRREEIIQVANEPWRGFVPYEAGGTVSGTGMQWYDYLDCAAVICEEATATPDVRSLMDVRSLVTTGWACGAEAVPEDRKWLRAWYHTRMIETFPVISAVRVILESAELRDDGDGWPNGRGDTYTFATAGVIGEPTPYHDVGTTGGESLDTRGTPFGVLQGLRFPRHDDERDVDDGGTLQYGSDGLGILSSAWPQLVDGGRGARVAALYFEVSIFDADLGGDDELGVHSSFIPFHALWSAVEECARGTSPDEFRIVTDEPGAGEYCEWTLKARTFPKSVLRADGVHMGHGGATVIYKVQIKPLRWPDA